MAVMESEAKKFDKLSKRCREFAEQSDKIAELYRADISSQERNEKLEECTDVLLSHFTLLALALKDM